MINSYSVNKIRDGQGNVLNFRYTEEREVKKLSEYYSLDIEIEQGEIKLDNLFTLDGNMYGDYEKEEIAVKEQYYKEITGITRVFTYSLNDESLIILLFFPRK